MLQWNGKDLTSEDVYFMSESFSRAARSAREMARMLLRWLVLALPIGLLCGGIGTAFHLAVEAVTELRGAHGWLLWLLPAAGLAIVALYKGTKCEGVGTNNVIRAVQSGEGVSPLFAALLTAADKLGIQYIGSSSRARLEVGTDGVHTVLPPVDAARDDSTALAALPQETLARLLLPLGEFDAGDLAELAQELQL